MAEECQFDRGGGDGAVFGGASDLSGVWGSVARYRGTVSLVVSRPSLFDAEFRPHDPAFQLPNDPVIRTIEALENNMSCFGKRTRKLAYKFSREILVKEKFHADAARRRSRIAANSRAART